MFKYTSDLSTLIISNNPLTKVSDHFKSLKMHFLEMFTDTIDLSFTLLEPDSFEVENMFNIGWGKQVVNLSHIPIQAGGLDHLSIVNVEHLDVTGVPFSAMTLGAFKDIPFTYIYTDNYRVCCSVLHGSNYIQDNCYGPPMDALSSCQNILMYV